MGAWLLDVNVLLAMIWPRHAYHDHAIEWFVDHRSEQWATCALTEIGFLRVITNPAFSQFAPGFEEAAEMLIISKRESGSYRFWASDIASDGLTSMFGKRLSGHQQITDAYLLALAVHNRGKLLTFDRRIRQLAPEGSPESNALTILES
jgi:uncharacterized protein